MKANIIPPTTYIIPPSYAYLIQKQMMMASGFKCSHISVLFFILDEMMFMCAKSNL